MAGMTERDLPCGRRGKRLRRKENLVTTAYKLSLSLLAMLMIGACDDEKGEKTATQYAELVYTNAKIFTVNDGRQSLPGPRSF